MRAWPAQRRGGQHMRTWMRLSYRAVCHRMQRQHSLREAHVRGGAGAAPEPVGEGPSRHDARMAEAATPSQE